MAAPGGLLVTDGFLEVHLGAVELLAVEPRHAEREPAARVVGLELHVLLEVRQRLGRLVPVHRRGAHRVVHQGVLGRQLHRLLQRLVGLRHQVHLDAHHAEHEVHVGVGRVEGAGMRKVPERTLVIAQLVGRPRQVHQHRHGGTAGCGRALQDPPRIREMQAPEVLLPEALEARGRGEPPTVQRLQQLDHHLVVPVQVVERGRHRHHVGGG